jgi:hypothetical protein
MGGPGASSAAVNTHTIPPKTTVTGAYYCSVFKTLINHIGRK